MSESPERGKRMGSRWYLDAPLVPEYHRRAIAVSCSSLLGLSLRYCCLLERQRFPEMSSPGAAASFWAAKTAKPSELHPLATRQPIWRPK